MNGAAQKRIPEKLQELIGELRGDVGGALVLVGDKLGFYRTMAETVPLSANESRGAHRNRSALRV